MSPTVTFWGPLGWNNKHLFKNTKENRMQQCVYKPLLDVSQSLLTFSSRCQTSMSPMLSLTIYVAFCLSHFYDLNVWPWQQLTVVLLTQCCQKPSRSTVVRCFHTQPPSFPHSSMGGLIICRGFFIHPLCENIEHPGTLFIYKYMQHRYTCLLGLRRACFLCSLYTQNVYLNSELFYLAMPSSHYSQAYKWIFLSQLNSRKQCKDIVFTLIVHTKNNNCDEKQNT